MVGFQSVLKPGVFDQILLHYFIRFSLAKKGVAGLGSDFDPFFLSLYSPYGQETCLNIHDK